MYTKVSIPKTSAGAGCARPKDPNVIVMFADEVVTEPTRSEGDVALTGNYTLGTGQKAVGLYLTPSTIEAGYDSEGDVDARGFKHRVAGEHPGDDVAVENFIEEAANRGVIILVKGCDGSTTGKVKAYGSKCNPLYLTPEVTDSKDANKTKLSFAQEQAQSFLPGVYSGTLPDLADADSTEETA